MGVAKITISLDQELLRHVDQMIDARAYRNRSQAIQAAVEEKVERLHRTRLAVECAKLDADEEQALADSGLAAEAAQWPPY